MIVQKVPNNRKGFIKKVPVKESIENPLAFLPHSACIIYGQSKLSHSGITCWKTFEGYQRKMHKSSLNNLLNQLQSDYGELPTKDQVREKRRLNQKQSRTVKSLCNKLCYYSRVRTFTSKKTGAYKFKVAFLTLTSPASCTEIQALKAFEHFLDYLRRTCNCTYVWKKELGEKNSKLHFHILINNFIPYYLISWKWKRVLLQEGVKWPKNEKGKDTDSHYRIELPRSRRLISHYIAKYMSKAYDLPRELGYLTGCSEVLKKCKEINYIESELPKDEILTLQKSFRTIKDQFLTHTCIDIRRIQAIAPIIHYHFMKQFEMFQEAITLPQKYWYT